MEKLISRLKRDYPGLSFEVGEVLCWSPAGDKIFYRNEVSDTTLSGLFHELAHACLQHQSFTSDLDLLHKEVAAWQEALRLAQTYGLTISAEHAEDCLDTYRDWLHKRSLCPACHGSGLQKNTTMYSCINCGHSWQVSSSRASRPYRLSNPPERKRAKT